jgi:asparagine synthase (glutamine-hydrolysing)
VTTIGTFSWRDASRTAATFDCHLSFWDGRIDNRADLRWRLESAQSRGATDGTLALAAYRQQGVAGLRDLVGDWSLVIRDERSDSIVLASDYAGVRPLYYRWTGGEVAWSTDARVLAEASGCDALDEDYMAGFLAVGGLPHRTPFRDIRVVPPGRAVCVSRDAVDIQPFWTLAATGEIRYRDERSYDEALRGLFRDAVAVRLQAREPVVAELSGGLDSSAVVCMADRLIRSGDVSAEGVTTVSFVHPESRDLAFIRDVETARGAPGVHLSMAEYPLVDLSARATMPEAWTSLYRAIADVMDRCGASALLTGQAGDLVTGNWYDDSLQVAGDVYDWHFGRACAHAFAWSRVTRTPAVRILARATRAALASESSAAGVDCGIDGHTSLTPAAAQAWRGAWPADALTQECVDVSPARRRHFRALAELREFRALQPLEPVRHRNVTHPFAHRPLVEFMMSVPADVLCRPGQPRRLMRRALADLWPSSVRRRRSKSLFGTPWFQALAPVARHLLASRRWEVVERGWVDADSLTARLQRLMVGLDCNEPQLRNIILLEYWLRHRKEEAHGEGHQIDAA